jgi:hypothetical protein
MSRVGESERNRSSRCAGMRKKKPYSHRDALLCDFPNGNLFHPLPYIEENKKNRPHSTRHAPERHARTSRPQKLSRTPAHSRTAVRCDSRSNSHIFVCGSSHDLVLLVEAEMSERE